MKGRLAFNGAPTRNWITSEDKSSPTVLNESLKLTCAVDAYENRDVMSMDVPNAYLHATLPQKEIGERVVMKIRGKLVDWLVEIDPLAYLDYVVIERGERVLYLQVLRAIYGMLEAGLLWYRKFRKDLEAKGFKFNRYDGCVANKLVKNSQQTIRFHVDDLLSSHKDPGVNSELARWAQKKYGNFKPVKVTRGKIHDFLGMKLDFSVPGECHISQENHIDELVSEWPEKIKSDDKIHTPAANNLFEVGTGNVVDEKHKGIFHRCVAKGLFISDRSRPDITPTISVLAGRVQKPNKSDWEKCRRLVRYLRCTRNLHLILRYDGCCISKWHIDASFAVHSDFRSHSGGILFLHEKSGGIMTGSTKQKLNTRSSTEAELVAADDFLAKVLWVRLFMADQGINLTENMVGQDNKSAIILEENGRASVGKRSRAMNIRYFAIKDSCDLGHIKIFHVPTDSMVGDFFTKPLQGEKFQKFRELILGMKNASSSSPKRNVRQ